MNRSIRVSLNYILPMLITILLFSMIFKNTESAQPTNASPEVHISKKLSIYSVSLFNDMLQDYCSKMDLKADYHGGLSPVMKRGGNRPLNDPDKNVRWTIRPEKITTVSEKPLAQRIRESFYEDDWFTICLTDQDNDIEKFQIYLKGEISSIKLSPSYGKFKGLNTNLPNKMTVRGFLSGLCKFSKTYQTREEKIIEIFDKAEKMFERAKKKKD